jgi:hypothetical protein
VLAHVVDGADVGVVQGRGGAGLTLETRETLGIGGKLPGQHLERHLTAELRIPRPVDLAHAARAERFEDLVPSESVA